MRPAITIADLTKDFAVGFARTRRIRALDRLRLEVWPGEIVGFLGANGAGKTTAIKLLTGLLHPTAGTARVCGLDIADISMHARIGYLPEQPYFYDYLTARELVAYCAQLFGYRRGEARDRAAGALARVGLEGAAWDRPLRRFSKGMLQRVGLAQALVNDPEVLFLDEPMSGLDPIGRGEMRDLIATLPGRGTTVLFSSHILADVEVLCHRVAVLRAGRLVRCGRLDELRQDHAGRVEIALAGVSAAALRPALAGLPDARVVAGNDGARIEVARESDVDEALRTARGLGARLLAVQPVRASLEDLLVR